MIGLVVISMNQDVNLVAEDYYEQEIKYQDQIDRVKNFNDLELRPVLKIDNNTGKCFLTFPDELVQIGDISGKVHFFRPSDSKQDIIFELNLTKSNSVSMDINDLIDGLWEVRVSWSDSNKEYYFVEAVYL